MSMPSRPPVRVFHLHAVLKSLTLAQVLARALRSHPSVVQNLRKIQLERGSIQTLIFKIIRELKDGKFDALRKHVRDEFQKRDGLKNTIAR